MTPGQIGQGVVVVLVIAAVVWTINQFRQRWAEMDAEEEANHWL